MRERLVEVPTTQGRMETFIVHPEGGGPFPCIVLYMDVWGLREELYDLARKVAVVGYYCAVPDLLYRTGRHRHEYRDGRDRTLSFLALTPDQQRRVLGPLEQHADDMTLQDTAALLDFVGRPQEPVLTGGMGLFGYCLGGRLGLKVAGRFADRFVASALMHPTMLVSDQPDSAHLSIPHLRGEVYFGFAGRDPWANPATVATVKAELQRAEVRSRVAVHENCDHGYALPDRDVFDKAAFNRDWEAIFPMFCRQIPPGAG